MLRSLPTTTPQRTAPGALVHYRQASPELGPAQPIARGEQEPRGEGPVIPNPSC
jgi:hypothetical protein